MTPFNLMYLKYFCDAVQWKSVSAAAKANSVTQSAISQGISKLEEALGVPLVAKHPNRFKPTPEGEKAFHEGHIILRKVEQFQAGFSEEMMGALAFASTHSLAVSMIPRYLEKFRKAYPAVEVAFHVGDKDKIKQLLKMGKIDFGIMADEQDLADFDSRKVFNGFFGMYCATHLKKKQIEQLAFILTEDDCREVIFLKDAYFRKHQKLPAISMRVSSWEIVAHFAAAGLGIGYFPDYIAEGKKERLRPCDPDFAPFSYRIAAIYPRGMRLSRSSEAFLSLFLNAK